MNCLPRGKSNGSNDSFGEVTWRKKQIDSYLEGVKQNGRHLGSVPDEFVTFDMCMAALRSDGRISDVPNRMRNEELYVEAVKYCMYSFHWIPEEDLTEAICLELMKHDGMMLPRIPERCRTTRVIETALKQAPLAIQFVEQNADNCRQAVEADETALKFIDRQFITKEMIDNIEPFFGIERYVPTEYMTEELWHSIDEFYVDCGWIRVGPFVIYLNPLLGCHPFNLCHHEIVMADGQTKLLKNKEIHELLKNHNLSHPHFDMPPEKSDDSAHEQS